MKTTLRSLGKRSGKHAPGGGMARSGARRPPARDDGASAVEFALVLPLLLMLLFGIIDYGWWFGESLGLRSGVREAARLSAVNAVIPGANSADAIKAVLLQRSPQLNTDADDLAVAVRIYGPGATGEIPGVGSTILVCAQFPGESLSGLGDVLYPIPEEHSAEATMRLEKTPVLSDAQTSNWTGTCALNGPPAP